MPAPLINADEAQRNALLHSVRIAYAKMYTERISCRRALTTAKEPLSKLPAISNLGVHKNHSLSDLQSLLQRLEERTRQLITMTQETRDLAEKKEDAEMRKWESQFKAGMNELEVRKNKLRSEEQRGEYARDEMGEAWGRGRGLLRKETATEAMMEGGEKKHGVHNEKEYGDEFYFDEGVEDVSDRDKPHMVGRASVPVLEEKD